MTLEAFINKPWQYDRTCSDGGYHAWKFHKIFCGNRSEFICEKCGTFDYPEGDYYPETLLDEDRAA